MNEPFRDMIARLRRERFAAFRPIAGARVVKFQRENGGGWCYVLHRTCSGEPQRWRVTTFDPSGEPTGHVVYRSRAAAFREWRTFPVAEVLPVDTSVTTQLRCLP